MLWLRHSPSDSRHHRHECRRASCARYYGFLITMVVTGLWAIHQLYVYQDNQMRAAAKASEVPNHLVQKS